MRAVCFQDVHRVVVDEVDDPVVESATDAIIKVDVAGLCGSDLHPYFGREHGLDPGTVMGHEFVGTVIDKGDAVRSFDVGDRVCSPFTTSCGKCFYCQNGLSARCEQGQLFGWRQYGQGLHGGQAEQVRVPLADGTLVKIPAGVTPEQALLLGDNLSTAYFGAALAIHSELPDACVVIVGCGTVGLLAVKIACDKSPSCVVAIDPNAKRAQMAERQGATAFTDEQGAIEFVRRQTAGRGADSVLEFVGLPAAQRLAFKIIRPGGRMSMIGFHTESNFAFAPSEAYDKNLTICTGRCPARSLMESLVDRFRNEPLATSWCITQRFGLHEGVSAYDVFGLYPTVKRQEPDASESVRLREAGDSANASQLRVGT